jgi:hypothetical protein
MTVNELITHLNCIENKDKKIGYRVNENEFTPLDKMIGVGEYADVVVLQHEIIVPKE